MTHRSHTGFTLIELMTVTAIIAILVGIALPAFASARAAGQTLTLRQGLLAAITQARSAAAFYEQDTILCPSRDGETCDDRAEWQDGFIAAVDLDHDNHVSERDRAVFHQPAVRDTFLSSTTGRRRIQFQPNGSNAGSNVTFTFCDRRGPTRATSLVMNNRGDLRETRASATAIVATCRL